MFPLKIVIFHGYVSLPEGNVGITKTFLHSFILWQGVAEWYNERVSICVTDLSAVSSKSDLHPKISQ